ncbi:MAG: sugar transferase, partial [Acidimicrobiales bacterium]
LTPVLAVSALAVKLTSRGPVLFRQQRVGRNGVAFELLKLRTMIVGAEAVRPALVGAGNGPLFKLRDDPRRTRVGRWLRRFSLDELPQLWNVLRGDMSLVGPRPALASEVGAWSPELHQRLRVKPGITGMWQVEGRSDASFATYERLDLYYVDNWSLLRDVVILFRTIPAVLSARGAY